MSDDEVLREELENMTVDDVAGSTFTASAPTSAAAQPTGAPSGSAAGSGAGAQSSVNDKFMGEKERRRSSAVKTFVGDNLNLANNAKVMKKMQKHSDKKVVFSDYVIKVNRRNKMQKRVLMISDNAIYNLDPANFQCKRRIPFTVLGSISMSKLSDNFFSLHMPSEYDYLMVSGKKVEIVTHIMEAFKEANGREMKISFNNSFDYRIDGENVREIHFSKVEGGVSTQIYTKSSKK